MGAIARLLGNGIWGVAPCYPGGDIYEWCSWPLVGPTDPLTLVPGMLDSSAGVLTGTVIEGELHLRNQVPALKNRIGQLQKSTFKMSWMLCLRLGYPLVLLLITISTMKLVWNCNFWGCHHSRQKLTTISEDDFVPDTVGCTAVCVLLRKQDLFCHTESPRRNVSRGYRL